MRAEEGEPFQGEGGASRHTEGFSEKGTGRRAAGAGVSLGGAGSRRPAWGRRAQGRRGRAGGGSSHPGPAPGYRDRVAARWRARRAGGVAAAPRGGVLRAGRAVAAPAGSGASGRVRRGGAGRARAAAARAGLLLLLLRLPHSSSRRRPDGHCSRRLRSVSSVCAARPCPVCRRLWRAWITSPPTCSWPSPRAPWCTAGGRAPRARALPPAWKCARRAERPPRLGHRGRLRHLLGSPPAPPPPHPTCWLPVSWPTCAAGPPLPRGTPHPPPPHRPLRPRPLAAPPAPRPRPPRATAVPSRAAPKRTTSPRTSNRTCERTQVSPAVLRARAWAASRVPTPAGTPKLRGAWGGGRAGATAAAPAAGG